MYININKYMYDGYKDNIKLYMHAFNNIMILYCSS